MTCFNHYNQVNDVTARECNFCLNNILVQINDEDLKFLSNIVGYPGARQVNNL